MSGVLILSFCCTRERRKGAEKRDADDEQQILQNFKPDFNKFTHFKQGKVMKNKMRFSLLVAGVASLCNVALGQSVDQGKKFLYYQRYKSAKDALEKTLASNPNNIEAVYWLGQTLLQTKDSVGAENLYSKALQSNGNAPLLLVGMGGGPFAMDNRNSGGGGGGNRGGGGKGGGRR